jgi:hypothetical protein
MSLEKNTIEFYDWFEIQTEICKEMGIEEEYFRDYHKLIGGDYKDLWHEWLNYFDSEITNGSTVYNDLGENIEYKKEWVAEDGKEWLFPFIDAIYKIWDDYEIEYVKYSW